MPSQFSQSMVQLLPSACVADITAPTFAGIVSAVPQDNGSVRVNWASATDITGPITYDIYIASGTVLAAALFVAANIVQSARPSGAGPFFKDIYALPDGTYLAVNGTYTFGIRCRDGVGNENTNLVVATAISEGVPPDCLQDLYVDLTDLVSDMNDVLSAMSAGGGTALTASLQTETVLDVDLIESV